MLKNLLLATKFSPKAERARDVAAELVRALDAKLHVLTVHDLDYLEHVEFDLCSTPSNMQDDVRQRVEQQLHNYVAPLKEQGVNPVEIVRAGDAEEQIVDTAREIRADLIIVGAGTRKGMFFDRFLQNVADKVRKRAICHVLTIT